MTFLLAPVLSTLLLDFDGPLTHRNSRHLAGSPLLGFFPSPQDAFVRDSVHECQAYPGCPRDFHGAVGVDAKTASSDSPEVPAAAFEHSLAAHVLLVAIRTVPLVAIALDRKAALHTFNYQVDAVATDFILRDNAITTFGNP
jgi:hypothetical protein